jgi:eukaryotic-like serine/threonine-protein kinase
MPIEPRDEALLREWLLDWEEGYERGDDRPPAMLCGDRVDLIQELRRRIALLKAFEPTPALLDGARTHRRSSASCLARFFELKLHAAGGLGEVYEARDVAFSRQVALKFLKPGNVHQGETVDRFRGEAEITGRLEHPGIVPIYGIGEDNEGHPCYAMRFVRGLPMDEAIRNFHEADGPELAPGERDARLAELLSRIKGKPLVPIDALDLHDRVLRELLMRFMAVSETVAYANNKHVLHRDLKPANVMLGKFGETLLIDWGLARTFEPASEADGSEEPDESEQTMPIDPTPAHLTPTVGPKGTPAYMSPEQASARRDLGPSSDVYSLGATLYCLLTGRAPFRGKAIDVLAQVREGSFERPRVVNPGVPRALEAVCLKAMALRPVDRYASAMELADDIDNWLAARPVTAWREPFGIRVGRWMHRHRTAVTATATSLIVAMLVLGGTWWRIHAHRLSIEVEAKSFLETAERLSIEAKDNPAKWNNVRIALERNKALLESTGVDSYSLRKVSAMLDVYQDRERDRLMVRELEEARLKGSSISDRWGFDQDAKILAYRNAFRAYGIEPETFSVKQAVDLIRSSEIHEELITGIDEWRYSLTDKATRNKLFSIARRADDDPLRAEIRDRINRNDGAALRGLAARIDVASSPTSLLRLLGEHLISLKAIEVAISILRPAQEHHPDDFWLNYQLARAYSRLHPPRHDTAVRYSSAALAIRPDSPGANNFHGTVLAELGDNEGAAASYRRAVELKPAVASYHSNLGEITRRMGNAAGAAAECRRAIALKPDYALAHNNLGNALQALGDNKGAAASYRRAIELKPNDATYHSNLGAVLSDLGDHAGAVAECRHAIALKPELPEAHANLGFALSEMGDQAGSAKSYRRAIELKPDDADYHNDLGVVLSAMGDQADAATEYHCAIDLKPGDADFHLNLGNLLTDMGDEVGASRSYRRAIELEPHRAFFHYKLGKVLSALDNHVGAAAEYRRSIELKIDSLALPVFYAFELDSIGDHAGALTEYRRAVVSIRQALESKANVVDHHILLGVALDELGNYADAAVSFRQALVLKNDHATAHCRLGIALEALGDHVGSVASFRRAVELKPDYDLAHSHLADVLGALGDHVGSVASFRRALELEPNDPEGSCALGFALGSLGQFAEALSAFRRAREIGSKDPYILPLADKWVHICEQLIALQPRRSRILNGEDNPKNDDEASAFAIILNLNHNYLLSAQLYEKILSWPHTLAGDLNLGHRFDPACAAALAGCENSESIPLLDDDARVRWRTVARNWLWTDLAVWEKRLEGATREQRNQIKHALNRWKVLRELTGLRDEPALTKLPEAERVECRKLWAAVDLLLRN